MEKFGLGKEVGRAARFLRYNEKVVEPNTLNKTLSDDGGWYKIGLFLNRNNETGEVRIQSTTVADSKHVINFICKIDRNGKLLSGSVNTFAFGFVPMDQGYLDILYKEFEECPTEWDVAK